MRQYLFVYGSLKRGQILHHRLGGKPIFQTTLKGFDCYVHPAVWYPSLIKGTRSIIGEVYEISPMKLKEIDVIEGVSSGLYFRESVHIKHPKTYATMNVFVYIKTDVEGWQLVDKAIVEWPLP
jgi:gamma-glutamylcyclotransferase (GGCT)/AIG2-like uncharacterized protein YtfP